MILRDRTPGQAIAPVERRRRGIVNPLSGAWLRSCPPAHDQFPPPHPPLPPTPLMACHQAQKLSREQRADCSPARSTPLYLRNALLPDKMSVRHVGLQWPGTLIPQSSVQWPFCIAFGCPWARKGGSHPDLSLGSLRSLTPLAPPSDPACSMRRRAAAGFCLGAHRGQDSARRARRLRRAPP